MTIGQGPEFGFEGWWPGRWPGRCPGGVDARSRAGRRRAEMVAGQHPAPVPSFRPLARAWCVPSETNQPIISGLGRGELRLFRGGPSQIKPARCHQHPKKVHLSAINNTTPRGTPLSGLSSAHPRASGMSSRPQPSQKRCALGSATLEGGADGFQLRAEGGPQTRRQHSASGNIDM